MDQIVFKIFGWLINIDHLILFFLILGVLLLFTRWWRWGRRSVVLSSFILMITTIIPTGFWLVSWLENRFPEQHEIPSDAKGLILLGGSYDWYTTVSRDRPSYNLAGGRIIDFVALARKYPHLPILFTGGGRHDNPRANEAFNAKQTLEALGVDLNRITFEDKSKTTAENAINSYNLIKPKSGEKWVLVTSAYQMPRSVALFRGVGWELIPYPVDYHSVKRYPWYFINCNLSLGLLAWATGIREIGGMSTNYLAGRTKEWISAP